MAKTTLEGSSLSGGEGPREREKEALGRHLTLHNLLLRYQHEGREYTTLQTMDDGNREVARRLRDQTQLSVKSSLGRRVRSFLPPRQTSEDLTF